MPMSDFDHPIWIVISAAFVATTTAVCLCCYYKQWETPKDLLTVSTVVTAYFMSATMKRFARLRQRRKRK